MNQLPWSPPPPCCPACWLQRAAAQLVDEPFLGDVARIEWALHRSDAACDAVPAAVLGPAFHGRPRAGHIDPVRGHGPAGKSLPGGQHRQRAPAG